jgi:hypothetical protein
VLRRYEGNDGPRDLSRLGDGTCVERGGSTAVFLLGQMTPLPAGACTCHEFPLRAILIADREDCCMAICDGCGSHVDDAHIRRRIERLELATRFRPVHTQFLLIAPAPPLRPEDYFYRVSKDRSARSGTGVAFFDELAGCAGVPSGSPLDEEAALVQFQRQGHFLIGAVECPFETDADVASAIERAAPNLLRRVEISYKPKLIVLLSDLTEPLIAMFQANGWGDRLVLDEGSPFAVPFSPGRLCQTLDAVADRP